MSSRLITLFGILLAISTFAKEETWVCLGDSITHGGSTAGYLQLYWNLRHPGSEVVILNHGQSGGSADSGIKMLEEDVLKLNPTRVLVMFGMNDVWREQWEHSEPDEKEARLRGDAIRRYTERMVRIADLLGARMVVLTPTPYDQYSDIPGNRATPFCNDPGLATCREIVSGIAAAKKLPLVDLHRPMTAALQAHPEIRYAADRVHPSPWGHIVITALVARGLGESAEVAMVEKVATQDGLSFDYAPEALPFPLSDQYREAEAFLPITELFNREMLKVNGLSEGEWELRMEGRLLGTFSAKEFAQGVNLALLDTPNQRLAQEAFTKASRLNQIYVIFRDCRMGAWEKPGAKGYGAHLLKVFNTWKDHLGELEAEAEKLRADLRAIRPAKCPVTVSRPSVTKFKNPTNTPLKGHQKF